MTATYEITLGKYGITVPAHLEAQMMVPVMVGAPQRQGDLGIFPYVGDEPLGDPVPAAGAQLVVGEATGNTHYLDRVQGDVHWHRIVQDADDEVSPTVGVFTVAANSVAHVAHTDEHGVNGFGPGRWLVKRALELRDRVTLVAD
jgi:hypothetical protein